MTDYMPKPGDIISVKDFMNCIVHFLLTPVPDYNDKMTVVCSDGFRFIVKRNTIMGPKIEPPGVFNFWKRNSNDLSSGDIIPASYASSLPVNGKYKCYMNPPLHYNSHGNTSFDKYDDNLMVNRVVFPADDISDFNNSIVGLPNHKLLGRTPVPGELISIEDVEKLLNDTARSKYAWTYVFVHEWMCIAYENVPYNWPAWNNPGGPGWEVQNSWFYIRLDTELMDSSGKGILYDIVKANGDGIDPETYISIYKIQRILAKMYETNINYKGYETLHIRTCHYNCHSQCHSRAGW